MTQPTQRNAEHIAAAFSALATLAVYPGALARGGFRYGSEYLATTCVSLVADEIPLALQIIRAMEEIAEEATTPGGALCTIGRILGSWYEVTRPVIPALPAIDVDEVRALPFAEQPLGPERPPADTDASAILLAGATPEATRTPGWPLTSVPTQRTTTRHRPTGVGLVPMTDPALVGHTPAEPDEENLFTIGAAGWPRRPRRIRGTLATRADRAAARRYLDEQGRTQ